jgi:hypothetical protein
MVMGDGSLSHIATPLSHVRGCTEGGDGDGELQVGSSALEEHIVLLHFMAHWHSTRSAWGRVCFPTARATRCGIAQSDGRVLASEWCWWGCAGKLLACDMDMKREWSNAHEASVWELLLTRGDRYRLINR